MKQENMLFRQTFLLPNHALHLQLELPRLAGWLVVVVQGKRHWAYSKYPARGYLRPFHLQAEDDTTVANCMISRVVL